MASQRPGSRSALEPWYAAVVIVESMDEGHAGIARTHFSDGGACRELTFAKIASA
jgi:hypothetical protein